MRLLLAVALALLAAAPAAAAPRLVKIGDFEDPVHVASPPGDERVFVVEQRGVVKIAGTTFLDVRAETMLNIERGLLSIAFAPDYATSGRFYVFLTSQPDGDVEVREYRQDPTQVNRARPKPLRTLLKARHPATNHNGGQLQFGPDGMLYASVGDAAEGANAQDPGSPLGKLLRIDPATGAVETWASGLRNPWRFTFDRPTGDLLIGDVGQSAWEEVDWSRGPDTGRGLNYGWPCREGGAASAGCVGAFTEPAFSRAHDHGFSALIGGYVVRDPGLPTLAGRYLYGDSGMDYLRSVVLPDGDDRAEPLRVSMLSSFGEDACGRLYAASLGSDAVYRIQDGTATPCMFGAAPDLRAPRVKLRRRARRVVVRCSERCRLTAVLDGRTVRRRSLRAGRRLIVRLPRGPAALKIRARDVAGNERVVTRRYSVPSGASGSRSPL